MKRQATIEGWLGYLSEITLQNKIATQSFVLRFAERKKGRTTALQVAPVGSAPRAWL
jgi:hypothetical protein